MAGVRTLITGANGLLGSKLLALAGEQSSPAPAAHLREQAAQQPLASAFQGPSPEVVPTGAGPARGLAASLPAYRPLDVSDPQAVDQLFDEVRPGLVLHAAAMTDVDGCERRRGEAWAVNVQGTAAVARAAARVGARLVYISTEYVFDGSAGPYGESDLPNPRGVYAVTKYAGEKAVEIFCADHVIARTTVVYGFAPGLRPNFATWLLGAVKLGQSVRIVSDQIGSPTLADNLAAMVWALGRGSHRGVVHAAGDAILSRHEFALALCRAFSLDASRVAPVTTAALQQAAPRPLRAGLIVDLAKRLCGPAARPLTLDESLAELRRQMGAAAW